MLPAVLFRPLLVFARTSRQPRPARTRLENSINIEADFRELLFTLGVQHKTVRYSEPPNVRVERPFSLANSSTAEPNPPE